MCLLLMHRNDDKPVLLRGSGFLCGRVAAKAYAVLCEKECNNCVSLIHQKNACKLENSFMRHYRVASVSSSQKKDLKDTCSAPEPIARVA